MADRLPHYVHKFACTKVSTGATTYHLRPDPDEPLAGWALATVNDATGELAIQSDWGNWSFRWNIDHLGQPSLTHFIGRREGCHYLADKLTSREEREHFDSYKTAAHMQRELAKHRLEWGRDLINYYEGDEPEDRDDVGTDDPIRHLRTFKVWSRALHQHEDWPLTRATARRIFDELEELRGEDSPERFVDAFFKIEGHDIISSEPWYDDLKYVPTPAYMQLLHGILPALVAACRARVEERAA